MALQYPLIGAWYRDQQERQTFEVVAIDDELGSVEIQYVDGSIGELELDVWSRLSLVPVPSPEDTDSALDLSREDRWCHDQSTAPLPWDDPLDRIEAEFFPGTDID